MHVLSIRRRLRLMNLDLMGASGANECESHHRRSEGRGKKGTTFKIRSGMQVSKVRFVGVVALRREGKNER